MEAGNPSAGSATESATRTDASGTDKAPVDGSPPAAGGEVVEDSALLAGAGAAIAAGVAGTRESSPGQPGATRR